MLYKFIDTNEANLRSLASIQVIINDYNLDQNLCGYRTLNVSGRSVVGRDIDTFKYSARKIQGYKSNRSRFDNRGSNIFYGSDLQGVLIEVEFLLHGKDNKEFRRRLSKLTNLIHQEQAQWVFTDDPTYYYVGTINEMEDFKEDSNIIKSTFKIICVDSYKTSVTAHDLTGSGTRIQMLDIDEIVSIEDVILTLKEDTNKLIIKNQNQDLKIIIDHDFKSGDVLTFSPDEDIKINGRNAMTRLDILSDKEDFNIQGLEVVTLTIPCDYQITYRLRSL